MTDAGWAEKAARKVQLSVRGLGPEPLVQVTTVAALLNSEHTRSVRIVKATRKGVPSEPCEAWKDGYMTACDDTLTALQRGRGGKG